LKTSSSASRHRRGGVAEVGLVEVALAGGFQVDQLLEVLLGAEVAFELADEAVERPFSALDVGQRLAEQVEAPVASSASCLATAAAVS
jgi:hypothetical protein